MRKKINGRIKPLYDESGFTLVELIVAFLIISILATMGAMYMADLRNRSSDSQAYTEGRHLLTALNDTFLADEDVKFDTSGGLSGISGELGTEMSGGGGRTSIFRVSDDVRVRMSGSNGPGPSDGLVEVWIWAKQGTPDSFATNDDGNKEYYYVINEETGEVSVPDF